MCSYSRCSFAPTPRKCFFPARSYSPVLTPVDIGGIAASTSKSCIYHHLVNTIPELPPTRFLYRCPSVFAQAPQRWRGQATGSRRRPVPEARPSKPGSSILKRRDSANGGGSKLVENPVGSEPGRFQISPPPSRKGGSGTPRPRYDSTYSEMIIMICRNPFPESRSRAQLNRRCSKSTRCTSRSRALSTTSQSRI